MGSAVSLLFRKLTQDTRPTVLLNDNAMFEYILQDELFIGIAGILECELEF